MEFQTRANNGEIQLFKTFKEALDFAQASAQGKGWIHKAECVWKISFSLPNGERIRLVREYDSFVLAQMDDAIKEYQELKSSEFNQDPAGASDVDI